MSFRDVVQADLQNVFLNENEFGEKHTVDGQEIDCIIDNDALKERPRQPLELYHDVAGVYVNNLVIYVRGADLEERPVIGQHLRFDGQLHLVKDCNENMGLLTITLEANEA